MAKLEHLSVIKVSGDDADEFLQGQMTQSTEVINEDLLHLTSFCNPQGRVVATALIQSWNEHYYLILSSDLIDDLIAWLSRYILRSKVIIGKEEINIYGIGDYEKNNFDKSNIQSSNQSLKVLSIDKNRSIFLSRNDKEEQFQTISKEDWITQDIKSGLPLINKINTIKYIDMPLSVSELKELGNKLGLRPKDFIRKGESVFKDLNLLEKLNDDDTLFNAMSEFPKLLERPIVVNGDYARIGRPPEKILEII